MEVRRIFGLAIAVYIGLLLAYTTVQAYEGYNNRKVEKRYMKLVNADLHEDMILLNKLLSDDSIDLLNLQFILERANSSIPYDVGDQAFRLLYRTSFTPQCITYDLMMKEAGIIQVSDLATKYGLGFLYGQLYPQMEASDQKMAVHINNFLIPHTINAVGVNDDMMRFSLIKNQSYLNALIMYKVMLEGNIAMRKNALGYLHKVKEDVALRME